MGESLHFKISTGLKNIIGKELITDKYIAIFELVKNAYDANASEVIIQFNYLGTPDAKITIIDNGQGMDKNDIIQKWLFVAYSEKKRLSYRDSIKNRAYAGAKGIGRFSCDRLGSSVELTSSVANSGILHIIKINWDDFERDNQDDFASIDVTYDSRQVDKKHQGTSICITDLREFWDRKSIINLKKALTQLVNPNATDEYDSFTVKLCVPDEANNDANETEYRNRINGEVKNYLFDALNIKTTKIKITISADGKTIETVLTDRGTHLFTLIEKNEFSLKNVVCSLFSLNKIAKLNFTRIMGVQPVHYGSVFIYKNGFRVMPYGEPDIDFFKINQRKGQGHSRYLGTREIIGQIELNGIQSDFIETSSRNHGFIETKSYEELESFFKEYALKPLEKYVFNIIKWGEADDLLNDKVFQDDNSIFDDILKKVKPHTRTENVVAVNINQELLNIIEERKDKTLTKAAKELISLAAKQNDTDIIKAAKIIEKETSSLQALVKHISEDKERTQQDLDEVSGALTIANKQISVLKGRAELTADEAISAMHIMKGYADAIDSHVDEAYELLQGISDTDELFITIGDISRIAKKIKNSYGLVLNTNYSANTDITRSNIVAFCKDYSKIVTGYNVELDVLAAEDLDVNVQFNPLEFSIIIDNLLSNSSKAKANVLHIFFETVGDYLEIRFIDDGNGLSRKVQKSESIFEPGFSTTGGSGIGLQTIVKYLGKINGTVFYNEKNNKGFELIARIKL